MYSQALVTYRVPGEVEGLCSATVRLYHPSELPKGVQTVNVIGWWVAKRDDFGGEPDQEVVVEEADYLD